MRGICSPFHVSVSKNKLKPEAFDPFPGTDEVSVMRVKYLGDARCKLRAKALERLPTKSYRGVAVFTAELARKNCAVVVDSRRHYLGHADIHYQFEAPPPGEPLPAEVLSQLRPRLKELSKRAKYIPDPLPQSCRWSGEAMRC